MTNSDPHAPRAVAEAGYGASALIVHGSTISLDGYGAGPQRSLEAPLGKV